MTHPSHASHDKYHCWTFQRQYITESNKTKIEQEKNIETAGVCTTPLGGCLQLGVVRRCTLHPFGDNRGRKAVRKFEWNHPDQFVRC